MDLQRLVQPVGGPRGPTIEVKAADDRDFHGPALLGRRRLTASASCWRLGHRSSSRPRRRVIHEGCVCLVTDSNWVDKAFFLACAATKRAGSTVKLIRINHIPLAWKFITGGSKDLGVLAPSMLFRVTN